VVLVLDRIGLLRDGREEVEKERVVVRLDVVVFGLYTSERQG
jgi:hypothetical protein